MTTTNDDARVWRVDEAARHLRVSQRTIYRLLAAGELVRVPLGTRTARVLQRSVLDYVNRQQHAADPPPSTTTPPDQDGRGA